MNNISAIADAADMIVNGYAFTVWGNAYRVWSAYSKNAYYED